MTQDQWEEGKALLADLKRFQGSVVAEDRGKYLIGAIRYLHDFLTRNEYREDVTDELGERP